VTVLSDEQRKDLKPVLAYAVSLLARQEQSVQRLREKLLRKGYAAAEAEKALQTLQERHYLDDGESCARQFQFLYEESRQSVRQICAKLRQRGFPSQLVQGCVPEDTYAREKAAAGRCLELKFRPSADSRKMQAYLYRHGFDSSAIRAAVEEFAEAAGDF
jgi:regulatory protein